MKKWLVYRVNDLGGGRVDTIVPTQILDVDLSQVKKNTADNFATWAERKSLTTEQILTRYGFKFTQVEIPDA